MPTPRRSVRLKKYETVYKKYLKKKVESPKVVEKTRHKKHVSPTPRPKEEKKETEKKKEKHSLNTYQKFVKEESQKDKYKQMKGSERLTTIAKAWEKHKRKMKKDVIPFKNNPKK